MLICSCCGRALEMDTELRRGKCSSCSLGLCRCQNTPEEEARADRLVDDLADAAGMGDVAPEHECGPDCADDFDCYLLSFEKAEDRADVVAKAVDM